jgi:hypothetical protein
MNRGIAEKSERKRSIFEFYELTSVINAVSVITHNPHDLSAITLARSTLAYEQTKGNQH